MKMLVIAAALLVSVVTAMVDTQDLEKLEKRLTTVEKSVTELQEVVKTYKDQQGGSFARKRMSGMGSTRPVNKSESADRGRLSWLSGQKGQSGAIGGGMTLADMMQKAMNSDAKTQSLLTVNGKAVGADDPMYKEMMKSFSGQGGMLSSLFSTGGSSLKVTDSDGNRMTDVENEYKRKMKDVEGDDSKVAQMMNRAMNSNEDDNGGGFGGIFNMMQQAMGSNQNRKGSSQSLFGGW